MVWSQQAIDRYRRFVGTYVSEYKDPIDCADLALASLVDFAAQSRLPVRLKYYSGSWKWYQFRPDRDSAVKFKNTVLIMLGALNVIDNTKPVTLAEAKPGDMVMTKWSPSLGHTRIIYQTRFDSGRRDYEITWYQGNLPPVVPERRIGYLSEITNVYGGSPRKWNFVQFDA
jgi:hypothetical protein